MSKWQFVLAYLLIVGVAFASHLFFVTRTPIDWDEPVYTQVALGVQQLGYPSLGQKMGEANGYYPFHPPLHFFVLASWNEAIGTASIEWGRVLSSLIATATVAVAMLFTYRFTASKGSTLIAGMLLAMDGWFSYSSLLVKFDTAAILIALIGMWLVIEALQGRSKLAILAGLLLGLAAVYKHIAVIALISVVIHWVVTRGDGRGTHRIIICASLVIAAYFVIMITTVGDPYIQASLVQIRRTLGLQEARGLQYGIPEAIEALAQTYWAFGGTLLMMLIVPLTLGLMAKFHRDDSEYSAWLPLTIWIGVTIVVLAGLRLRNPHYLSYLIVPGYILAAIFLRGWLERPGILRRVSIALIVLVSLSNVVTWGIRLGFSGQDSLRAVQQAMATMPPDDIRVISEEPICVLIQQPCTKFGFAQTESRIAAIDPQIVIVYRTVTQAPPETDAIAALLSRGVLIYPPFVGWRDTIEILGIQ